MFLKKGDLIDIISPASSITKNDLAKIKLFLEANGLRARFHMGRELLLDKKQPHNFPSFLAEKRFEQLQFALENKESKAVWCTRGGYGSVDLIPLLQASKKIAQNKIFIGFSDITSLGIFLQQSWNWEIIYGPMLNQLAQNKVSPSSKKMILDLLFGKKTALKYKLEAKNSYAKSSKTISAEVVGGCLSVLATHFSTLNQIDFNDKILLLEDIDESGEKLDRYFSQLVQIMLANKSYPSAILLGNYYLDVTSLIKKKNITFAIGKFVANLLQNKINIPIFEEKTKCLGHSKNIMPITIGKIAKISDNLLTQNF
ncbi:MAG: LD-carboxypeptidase [Rickettsiales bacterium]|nr:LD-carboxypeptidase [Rickettsiales bacterium]